MSLAFRSRQDRAEGLTRTRWNGDLDLQSMHADYSLGECMLATSPKPHNDITLLKQICDLIVIRKKEAVSCAVLGQMHLFDVRRFMFPYEDSMV